MSCGGAQGSGQRGLRLSTRPPSAATRRFGALLRAACAKRAITRREGQLNAAPVGVGIWRFSQASPLSHPNPRRVARTGALCYIRLGVVQRRCPFLARPSEA